MKAEFSIEQIREFVKKNYRSITARIAKSALQHYDDSQSQSQWISVKKRLPDAGQNVLALTEYHYEIGVYDEVLQWSSKRGRAITVTHWQSLPQPPKNN